MNNVYRRGTITRGSSPGERGAAYKHVPLTVAGLKFGETIALSGLDGGSIADIETDGDGDLTGLVLATSPGKRFFIPATMANGALILDPGGFRTLWWDNEPAT